MPAERAQATAAATSALAGFALTGLLLTGCGGPSDPEPVVIEINERAFSEASVTVPAGTEVRWVNRAGRSHTVTSESPHQQWDEVVYPGELASVRLDEPGDYLYFCRFHRDDEMIGTITVEPL